LIDSTLAEKGAKAITPRGETDVALGTVFDDFDEWQDKHLWPALNQTGESGVVSEVESLVVDISTSARASHLNHHVQDALVIKNEILSGPDTAEKRHMEIKLPTNVTYEAGDYIAILPVNNTRLIGRGLLRFGLPWDATMTIKKGSHTTIPMQQSLSVTIVLGAYVEMTAPATRKNIATVLEFTTDEAVKSSIFTSGSATPTPSVLELLESHPTISVPFSTYLSMLPPMRIRQYSISSSPLSEPTVASITYAVIDEGQSSTTVESESAAPDMNPSVQLSEQKQIQKPRGRLGVATSFLRELPPSAKIQVAIKKSHASFHLPLDDATTPIIMIAAGTGIAPFRGFIEERAAKIVTAKANKKAVPADGGENGNAGNQGGAVGASGLAEAVLFIGCHAPDTDLLYKSQLEAWEGQGAVKIYPAFSCSPELSAGCRYAQDRVWREREVVSHLFDRGARVYICGSGRLGKGVKEVAARLYKEAARQKRGVEVSQEEAGRWWEGLRGERFSVDVFD
jgi:cytochrome P450 / NADPH-cytochrome P450 reductase